MKRRATTSLKKRAPMVERSRCETSWTFFSFRLDAGASWLTFRSALAQHLCSSTRPTGYHPGQYKSSKNNREWFIHRSLGTLLLCILFWLLLDRSLSMSFCR